MVKLPNPPTLRQVFMYVIQVGLKFTTEPRLTLNP